MSRLSAGTWNSVLQNTAPQIQLDVFLWTPLAAAGNPAQPVPFSEAVPVREDPALGALHGIGQTS
jgi:hypothetical protein